MAFLPRVSAQSSGGPEAPVIQSYLPPCAYVSEPWGSCTYESPMKAAGRSGCSARHPSRMTGRRAEPQSRSMFRVASVVTAARTFVIGADDDEYSGRPFARIARTVGAAGILTDVPTLHMVKGDQPCGSLLTASRR
jgi:hypothetical protein